MGRKAAVCLAQRLGVDKGQPSADAAAAATADTGDKGNGSRFPSHNTAQTPNHRNDDHRIPERRSKSKDAPGHPGDAPVPPSRARVCTYTHPSTWTYKHLHTLEPSVTETQMSRQAYHRQYGPRSAPCTGPGRHPHSP